MFTCGDAQTDSALTVNHKDKQERLPYYKVCKYDHLPWLLVRPEGDASYVCTTVHVWLYQSSLVTQFMFLLICFPWCEIYTVHILLRMVVFCTYICNAFNVQVIVVPSLSCYKWVINPYCGRISVKKKKKKKKLT